MHARENEDRGVPAAVPLRNGLQGGDGGGVLPGGTRVPLPFHAVPPFGLQTFDELDIARDGRINPEEWATLVRRNPEIIAFMTLPVLEELTARFPATPPSHRAD